MYSVIFVSLQHKSMYMYILIYDATNIQIHHLVIFLKCTIYSKFQLGKDN